MLCFYKNNSLKNKISVAKGFTIIELLLVIVIIAILAAIIFAAIDPLRRFQDARDSRRRSEATGILSAIKINQIDNGGRYVQLISALPVASSSEVFMISDGVVTSGCDDANLYCDTNVTDDDNCIDLSELVDEGYMARVPISPNGEGIWSESSTGYTLSKSEQGFITVRACESENSEEIVVQR